MIKERIIVSLTTWSKRIRNIPIVLDTIFAQTVPPDFVVLNLSYDEQIPADVNDYIKLHDIKVARMPDMKVFKKLIPTLKKYPNDCVISIDDDWLYPETMIEDFMNIHEQYPIFPISGNRIIKHGMQCHCGCASLTKACFFGKDLDLVDDELMKNCPSDDIVYTFFANKNGHPYVRTNMLYFENMKPYNAMDSYSANTDGNAGIESSYNYLVNRFGEIDKGFLPYINDEYLANIIFDIHQKEIGDERNETRRKTSEEFCSTKPYRIGYALIFPIFWVKSVALRLFKN